MVGIRRIIIVGGGASGVLLAVHLLRHRPPGLIVTLVEKRPELGAGVAYATKHPDHLLNVRASNMSAFPDDPGHFSRWLLTGTLDCGPEGFAPRHLYRDYLAHLTEPLFLEGQLRRVRGEAVALREDGAGLELVCRDEDGPAASVRGDAVVVATGNEGPTLKPEPWRYAGWGGEQERPEIPQDAPVVVVGTGLTMVDRVLWLLHDGHTGPITAVSRHGFMPQAHHPGAPHPPSPDEVPFGAPVARLTAWLRRKAEAAERAGLGWRTAVDGLRPHTQALWAALPEDERRRFLRHVRPFWDVHRHRIAPQAAAELGQAIRRGQLRVLAGRVTDFLPRPGGVAVLVTPRGSGRQEVLDAAAVFECRGRAADVSRSENPFLQSLLRDGWARPDALGLGLDVTEACALIDARGRPSDRVYATGPITAGTFWEIVAVPDIRAQAARLAGVLATSTGRASTPPRLRQNQKTQSTSNSPPDTSRTVPVT